MLPARVLALMLVGRCTQVDALLAADQAPGRLVVRLPRAVAGATAWRLSAAGGQRQAEWAALGVAADRPQLAGMDHSATVCGYALECSE